MKLKNYHIARISAFLTLLVVFVGFRFGRGLERAYRPLVGLVPWVGFALLAGSLIGLSWYLLPRIRSHSLAVDKPRLISLGLLTLVLIPAAVLVSESLVLFPVERVHFVKYGLLAFCLSFSIKNRRPPITMIFGGITATLVSAVEETSQIWAPERVFDPRDLVLNASGAVFGALYAWVFVRWIAAFRAPQ